MLMSLLPYLEKMATQERRSWTMPGITLNVESKQLLDQVVWQLHIHGIMQCHTRRVDIQLQLLVYRYICTIQLFFYNMVHVHVCMRSRFLKYRTCQTFIILLESVCENRQYLLVSNLLTGSYICVSAFFRKDSFKVICGTYLGRLSKIRIGHDNSGLGPGWFLNKASCFGKELSMFVIQFAPSET